MGDINKLRKEYNLRSLDIKDLNKDPFVQFTLWFEEAQTAGVLEPNAMALSTVSQEGKPSCRMVLLKRNSEGAFAFYTNRNSRKGKELADNPYACGVFYWPILERQVIIEGKTEILSDEEAESYFRSRPRGSQLGAWASHQDQIISREELEEKFLYYETLFSGQEVPIPSYWGGYSFHPNRFEFWQGRQNRLHDRFCYKLVDQEWQIDRLAP